MATRAAHICKCGQRVVSGAVCQCQTARMREARALHDATRPNSAARGYGRDWKQVRAQFLSNHPHCSVQHCSEPSTEADHILSVCDRPDLRLAFHNLRAFCKPHHSQRTARDQGFAKGRGEVKTFENRQRPMCTPQRTHFFNKVDEFNGENA